MVIDIEIGLRNVKHKGERHCQEEENTSEEMRLNRIILQNRNDRLTKGNNGNQLAPFNDVRKIHDIVTEFVLEEIGNTRGASSFQNTIKSPKRLYCK